jgi:AraC-like DNA-binding protein
LKLHAGVAAATEGAPLASRYHVAFAAAEKALTHGQPVVVGEARPERSAKRLRELRDQLSASAGESPNVLLPRFERYVESVLAHCAYRTEAVRAEFAVGLERLAEPLLRSGALDEKAFDEMCAAIDAPLEEVGTIAALCDLYRRLVSEIQSVLKSPTSARQERNLQQALAYIGEHLGDPLKLAQVARVAGFAPGYFSKLFKREQGVAFEQYVRDLRLERAKQMLTDTNLSVERVQRFSGFRTRSLFFQAFRDRVGMTPSEFRMRDS